MSTLLIASTAAAVYFAIPSSAPDTTTGRPSAAVAQTAGSVPTASSQAQALEWLALIDAGQFTESRDEAGDALRERYSEPLWELGVRLRLNNYGIVLSRKLTTVDNVSAAAKIGSGDFQLLVFQSDFLRAQGVVEEVVMQRERGEWRVAAYELTKPDGQ